MDREKRTNRGGAANWAKRKAVEARENRIAERVAQKVIQGLERVSSLLQQLPPNLPQANKSKFRDLWTSTPIWAAVAAMIGAAVSLSAGRYSLFAVAFLAWVIVVVDLQRIGLFARGWRRNIFNFAFAVVIGAVFYSVARYTPITSPPTISALVDAFGQRFPWFTQPPKVPMIVVPAPTSTKITADCEIADADYRQCSNSEVLAWGKPLLNRLVGAINQNELAMNRRHLQYMKDHNQETLSDTLGENIDMNRYLERDYKNFVLYRTAVIGKLKGGDPTGFNPLQYLLRIKTAEGERLLLFDKDSHLVDAKEILENLQELTGLLEAQTH
ncbi:MAG: hypothetical protein ABSF23_04205 [Terracidiphilus sp.]|jgi:hypothetical protein